MADLAASDQNFAYLAEGNAKQARKRVAADVLIRDESGRILLVDPTYKPDWDMPGGMCEANERPTAAARRELAEELGLDLRPERVLVLDWVAPHGPWDDTLMIVFDGGVFDQAAVDRIRITDPEIRAFEFVTVEEAGSRLRPYVFTRAVAAVRALACGAAYREIDL